MAIVGMIIGWLLGATLTVGVPVAVGLPPPLGWVAPGLTLLTSLLVLCVLVALLYFFASLATTNGQPSVVNPFGALCLGMLIGVNAGANFMLAQAALVAMFGVAGLFVAQVVAAALSLINALAAFQGLAASPWFGAVLGWASWAMPMSWPATALGLLFLLVNLIAFVLGAPLRLLFEWWTGSVIVHGGVLYLGRNGYNLGNVSFFHPDFADAAPWIDPGPPPLPNPGSVQGLTFHETGHTLNVAACGALFHYVGFLDQTVLTGAFSFSEQLSEGHLHEALNPWIDWWRPPIGGIAGGQRNVPSDAPNAAFQFIPAPVAIPLGDTLDFDVATVPALATDPDNYPQGTVNPGTIPAVGFVWEALVPTGSAALFTAPNAAAVTLLPDIGGAYRVRLHHSDGANGSPGALSQTGPLSPTPTFVPAAATPFHATDEITVVEARTPGLLVAAVNTNVEVTSTGSSAGNAIPTFLWDIVQQPAGATPTLGGATTDTATFRTDLAGDYVVRLTVSALAVSHSSLTSIQVI